LTRAKWYQPLFRVKNEKTGAQLGQLFFHVSGMPSNPLPIRQPQKGCRAIHHGKKKEMEHAKSG
jgi:hypothetical protein